MEIKEGKKERKGGMEKSSTKKRRKKVRGKDKRLGKVKKKRERRKREQRWFGRLSARFVIRRPGFESYRDHWDFSL